MIAVQMRLFSEHIALCKPPSFSAGGGMVSERVAIATEIPGTVLVLVMSLFVGAGFAASCA